MGAESQNRPLAGWRLAGALGGSLLLHLLAVQLASIALRDADFVSPTVALSVIVKPVPVPAPRDSLLKNTLVESAEHAVARREPISQSHEATVPQAEPLAPAEFEETLGRVAEVLFYPPEALKQGLEGETILVLEVDAEGEIRSASVASSSGHVLLDEAALAAVRHLGTLPSSVAGRSILLPVRFRLL